jgi:DME family drug/metabolite transporter
MSWLADPGGLATALYLGIFTTAIAYTLFARGLRELAPTTVVTLVLAEPVTATALGILVLGERPGVSAAIGALLVLAGLLLLAVPRRGGTA